MAKNLTSVIILLKSHFLYYYLSGCIFHCIFPLHCVEYPVGKKSDFGRIYQWYYLLLQAPVGETGQCKGMLIRPTFTLHLFNLNRQYLKCLTLLSRQFYKSAAVDLEIDLMCRKVACVHKQLQIALTIH